MISLAQDEATAHVDTDTDALIQQTLRTSFSTCTVLTVAHRLNTVLHSDLICVLHQGRVVEFGSPASLADQQGGRFAGLLKHARAATAT